MAGVRVTELACPHSARVTIVRPAGTRCSRGACSRCALPSRRPRRQAVDAQKQGDDKRPSLALKATPPLGLLAAARARVASTCAAARRLRSVLLSQRSNGTGATAPSQTPAEDCDPYAASKSDDSAPLHRRPHLPVQGAYRDRFRLKQKRQGGRQRGGIGVRCAQALAPRLWPLTRLVDAVMADLQGRVRERLRQHLAAPWRLAGVRRSGPLRRGRAAAPPRRGPRRRLARAGASRTARRPGRVAARNGDAMRARTAAPAAAAVRLRQAAGADAACCGGSSSTAATISSGSAASTRCCFACVQELAAETARLRHEL